MNGFLNWILWGYSITLTMNCYSKLLMRTLVIKWKSYILQDFWKQEEKSPPPTSAIHIKSSVTLFGSNIISNSSNTHLLRSPPMDVSIPKKSFSSSPDTFGYNTMNENSNQDSNDSIAIYNELTEIDLHRMHLNILYNIIVMNIGVTGVHFLSSLLSSGVWNHLSVIYLGCILSLLLWIL